MEPTLVEQPSLRAGCVRHIGPYTQIGQAFGRLAPIATAAGLLIPNARLIGIYYDDPGTTLWLTFGLLQGFSSTQAKCFYPASRKSISRLADMPTFATTVPTTRCRRRSPLGGGRCHILLQLRCKPQLRSGSVRQNSIIPIM